MTNLTKRMMIAAAAMVVAAGAASAQAMKADIPFQFHAGKTVSEAGSYRVWVESNSGLLKIQTASGNQTYMFLTSSSQKNSTGEAKLVFACNDGSCTLVQVWSGDLGYSLPHAKQRDTEAELRVVQLRHDGE